MYSSNPEYVVPQVHSLDHQADSGPGQHEPTSSHLPPFHELIGSLSAPTDEASSPSSVASRRRISSTPSTPTAAAAYLDNLHESHCLRACHPHTCIQVEKYLKFDQIPDEPPTDRRDCSFEKALNEIVQASSEIARFVDQCRHDLENGYRNPSEKQVNAVLSSSMQIIRQLKAIRCAARDGRGRCCLESARRASTPPSSPLSSWGRSEQGDAPDEEDVIPCSDPLHHHYHTSHDHDESSTRDDNDIDKSWTQLMDGSEVGEPKIPNSRSPVMSSTESPLGVYHFGKEQRPAEEAQLEQRRYYHQQQQQQLHQHQHEHLQAQLGHYHSHPPAQPHLVLNQQQSYPHAATESPSATTGGKTTEPEPEPELAAPPTSPGPRIELAQITIARAFSATATNGSKSKSTFTSTPRAGDDSPTFTTLFSPTTETSPRKRRLRGERERERPERHQQHEPEAVAAAASSKAEEEEKALGGGPSRRPLRPYPYPYPYAIPYAIPFSFTQPPPPRPQMQMQMQMQMVPDTLNSNSNNSTRTKRSHPYPHEPQAPARSSPPHGPHLQTPITIISDSSRNGNGNGSPAASAAAANQVGPSILVPSAGISFFLNPHTHRYQPQYQPPSYPARDQQDRSPGR